nr:NADH dehydrogenase subunit 2 [Anadara broughtonii]UVJ66729.1 NADH dehydrogenase subunit 2 [Anadara broughtonii]
MINKKFTPEKVEWWVYPLFLLLLMVVSSVLSVRSWFIAFLMMDFVTIMFLLLISVSDKKCGLGTISFVTHQSIASAFLYLSFFLSCWSIFYSELVNLFTIVGLFWKMGLPPFHGWYSSIFMEVTWFNAFLLSSFLKVPPSILTSLVISYSDWKSLWWVMSVFAMLYSSLILVGQTSARGFFAYSSMGSTCWMILGAAISKEIFFFYFFTYSVMVMMMMMICKKWDIKNISGFMNISKKDGWVFACSSFSVAGIPPFAGFMPKLLICFSAILSGSAVLLLVVIGYIVASIISVAGYMDISNSSICARVFSFTCPIPKEKNKIYLSSLISFIFFFFHLVVGVITMGVNISHFYL